MPAVRSRPYCDGCPAGKTLTYDHCKRHPEWQVNVSGLVEYAKAAAANGDIDPLATLATRRAFLYRGKVRGGLDVDSSLYRRRQAWYLVFQLPGPWQSEARGVGGGRVSSDGWHTYGPLHAPLFLSTHVYC